MKSQNTTKIWNFLLPETGSHEFRVDHLESSAQMTVYVDGMPLEAPPGTTMFTGPCGSLLELRFIKRPNDSIADGWFQDPKMNGNWELLVNGFIVEQYTAGKRGTQDDSLRDLRSRPDGSYTIATSFSADGMPLNIVRKFRFTARGELHEVEVAHADWVWQIIQNGRLLDRRQHSVWENTGSCHFQIDVTGGEQLEAEVLMSWDMTKMIWFYSLLVNRLSITPYWTKFRGEMPEVSIPEVAGACSEPVIEHVEPAPVVPEIPAVLPQGVSYDSASCSYQANIRQNNKFLFLGEFRTVEEAHARYLEEAEKKRAAGN